MIHIIDFLDFTLNLPDSDRKFCFRDFEFIVSDFFRM